MQSKVGQMLLSMAIVQQRHESTILFVCRVFHGSADNEDELSIGVANQTIFPNISESTGVENIGTFWEVNDLMCRVIL